MIAGQPVWGMANYKSEKYVWRVKVDDEESGISVNDGKLRRLEIDGFVWVGIYSKCQVDPQLRPVDGSLGRVLRTSSSNAVPFGTQFGFLCRASLLHADKVEILHLPLEQLCPGERLESLSRFAGLRAK